MKTRFGVILLEKTEAVIRIYEADDKEWKLYHYEKKGIKKEAFKNNDAYAVIEIFSECFSALYSEHVGEWKICARFLPEAFTQTIELATGFDIEILSPRREQELLCKGMFTELW